MIRLPSLLLLLILVASGLVGCTPGGSGSSPSRIGAAGDADPSIREVLVPAGAESGRPRFSGDGEQVLLSWTEPTGDSVHVLRYARWTDRGWSEPQTAASGRNWFVNWADTPGVARWNGDGLLAHYLVTQANQDNPYAYDIHLATSNDGIWGGLPMLNDDGTATEHGFVSVVPGLNALVWLDGRGYETTSSMSLRFARMSPEGVASETAVLDDRVCDCCPTDAARTESGAVVVYRDRSPDEVRDIAIVRLVDGDWTEPALVHTDGWEINGCPVNGPAVAAAGEKLVVAWFTGAADQPRVLIAFSEDGGATFAPPIRLDDGDPVGRVDVVFDQDGTAVVSWLERNGEAVALRIRSVRAGGPASATTIANLPAGRESGYPALASVGDSILVAWTDPDHSVALRTAMVARPDPSPGD